MKHDEILQAAKEAGLEFESDQGSTYLVAWREEIELFAAIIEKRTIERCADIAYWADKSLSGTDIAAAIRKLGEQK